MEQRAIIDVVCKDGIENLASEIGALLGQELSCEDIKLQLLTKDSLFSDLERPPTTLTRMSVTGDKEGHCFLLARSEAAIKLGGTLIMLPEDMIEEHVQSGKLDGELNDAFGEVANIIAGVFTQSFVDKYSKTIRFIKQSVEELIPTKIDLASNEPCPPGNYYVASCQITAASGNLGLLELVVPAAIFELEDATVEEVAEKEKPAEPETTAAPAAETSEAAEPEAVAAAAEPPKRSFTDAKKLTDTVFTTTINQIGEEIGALLGKELVCDDLQLLMTSKADFFANHCTDKATVANMKVSGDKEGGGFMFTQVPDAVVLGGTLIMLPEEQIAELVSKKQLDGETEDAYNEVANILAGGLTQVFLDRYPKQLRFVRTESSLIVPTKIDPASDEPFPEGEYYLASFAISMEGYELNRILLLFPAQIFDLEGYQNAEGATAAADSAATTAEDNAVTGQPANPAVEGADPIVQQAVAAALDPAPGGPPVVLIISENSEAAQPFADILSSAQFDCKVLTFQEDIKAPFQQHQILGAILIMSQVNEKGFATAIKLQSTGKSLPPLIFAGPEWTRTTVLRAVKYGARDILVMPASGEEIEEKVSQHFRKAS